LFTLSQVNTRWLSLTVTRRLPGAAGTHACDVGDPLGVEGAVGEDVGAVGVDAPPSPPLQPLPNTATSAAAAHESRVMRG
jgi:hypothetical protein